MPNANDSPAMVYELRRQARGGEPSQGGRTWRRWVVWTGVVLVGLSLVGAGVT